MARKPGGTDQLKAAKVLLKKAKTADELRAAQAIVLPLELGLKSVEQTAVAIGRSVGITCTMRTGFARVWGGEKQAARSKRELRNRAKASLEKESQILDEVLNMAATGGVVIVPPHEAVGRSQTGQVNSIVHVVSDAVPPWLAQACTG